MYLEAWDISDSHCLVLWTEEERENMMAICKITSSGQALAPPVNRLIVPVLQRRELRLWQVSHVPRVTHLIKSEVGIRIQLCPTPKSPCVNSGQSPDVRIYFFLFTYLNVNYSKNKFPVVFISKVWLQEKNKVLQRFRKKLLYIFLFFPCAYFPLSW